MIYRYVSYRGHIISNHPWNCVIGSCNCRTLIKSIVTVNSIEFNYSPSTLIHTWLIMKAIVRHFFFFLSFSQDIIKWTRATIESTWTNMLKYSETTIDSIARFDCNTNLSVKKKKKKKESCPELHYVLYNISLSRLMFPFACEIFGKLFKCFI